MPTLSELKKSDPEKYEQLMEQYRKISQGVAKGAQEAVSGDSLKKVSKDEDKEDSTFKKLKSLLNY